ncbi:pendrin-like isoform X2 [Dendronephthya gigantea]|nr:pendrin-like isoform X2 [Dendronephthya gigantea]XP_028401983.1 pendrin-like isoform X2 [Dendronephthya gigantea]XP_028401984.1 pendrin-like isoform X2 [Dendronephthya gigantea]
MKGSLRKRCSDEWKKWSLRDTLHGILPITQWLPKYKAKEYLPGDIAAGLALGIMNIPQGLAFAMLSSLPPITGLYVALVPVFAYVIMGTSKHLSVGSFAVVSIMVGNVIDARTAGQTTVASQIVNGSMMNESSSANEISGGWSAEDREKIILSVTLCLVVGIMQTVMGILRLGFITIFLSDPLISGFTTGAACWVFTSQIKHIIAIYPERYSGPFALIKTYIDIFKNITSINLTSLIIGIICILILLAIKHMNEKYKDKLKFPIPAEFIVVVLSTGISYGAKMKQKYNILIVESVPRGLPPLSVPRSDLITDLVIDGFVISVVAFSVNVSLAKLFSQKHGYPLDANQELLAYGVQNIVSAFFSCFVSAASLGRSLIQENLGRTQIASVISCAIILLVLTVLAPLFEPLPNAVLAAIIIVAIRRLFKNFALVKELWKVNKIDALTWVITWIAVILFGIDLGLGIGVIFQILCLTYRLSKPSLSILGKVHGMDGVYDDINRYEDTTELSGIVIVRFQSPLCFINAERFKEKLDENVSKKYRMKRAKRKSRYPMLISDEKTFTGTGSNNSRESGVSSAAVASSECDVSSVDYVHSVIIDCSSFSFIDSVAVTTLSQIALEYERKDVKLYLVNSSYQVLKVLKLSRNLFDDSKRIHILPDISNALHHAYEWRHTQVYILTLLFPSVLLPCYLHENSLAADSCQSLKAPRPSYDLYSTLSTLIRHI